MFQPLPSKFDFVAGEKDVLAFWDRHDVFRESMRQREGAPRFVFYEGPPTANGLPHPGHCLTRVIKDIFPRYKTMTGSLVERKAGWDTHGLPVEREVEKELIAAGEMKTGGKAGIEEYGVERFVLRCIESVFRYTREWEELTRRLGYWCDLKDAYVTFHQSYVESVWWSLKTLFERGLLYQAHKVVWWWAQGGTALSAGEVGEEYRTVDDPSVFVKFPLVLGHTKPNPKIAHLSNRERAERFWQLVEHAEVTATQFDHSTMEWDDDNLIVGNALANLPSCLFSNEQEVSTLHALQRLRELGEVVTKKLLAPKSLLVWTTTPWTLVSNQFAAVHPELEYSLVHDDNLGENLFVASALVETISKKIKRDLQVLCNCKGTELVDEWYRPAFDEAYAKKEHWDETRRETVPMEQAFAFLHKAAENGEQFQGKICWRVLAADFVTIESGTGLVHEAPAFGEVDFNLLQEERKRFKDPDAIPLLCAVNPDGTFNDDAPPQYRGRWVKDCDKDIVRELRDERKTPWGTPLLYHQEQYRHEYPFCPRAPEDPLIQYARKSWFVRTSRFKDEFIKNNAAVNWLPEHIKEGRFGDFLRNNVDWALSRERYWGTPLPIWTCEKCRRMEALASFAELKEKKDAHDRTDGGQSYWEVHNAQQGGNLPDHLRVHKPYIDAWTYASECCAGARMRRVPEVIDCWWDAGSMPFAQWGVPHKEDSLSKFIERFPADFISEAIDQTRGWFYGLLSISTLLCSQSAERWAERVRRVSTETRRSAVVDSLRRTQHGQTLLDRLGLSAELDSTESVELEEKIWAKIFPGYPVPYRTCICLGHILGEDGTKMSKRLKNYKEPTYIFDTYGADAMRWFFLSAQPPWTTVRFQEAALRDAQRDFLVKLYNVLSFFTIYASIDGFEAIPDAAHGKRPTAERSELDRWIISELHLTIRSVREHMDRFENFPAAQRLNEFVDALSNWFVRRSRERFWRPVGANAETRMQNAQEPVGGGASAFSIPHPAFSPADQDKWDAYHTLYGCLYTLSLLIAPFTPFFAESMYQTLTKSGSACRADQAATPQAGPHAVSVHLCDYPTADEKLIDNALAADMDAVREICSLGLAARNGAKLKVRQPLGRVEIILARPEQRSAIESHAALIAEELNVKSVEFAAEADHYVSYKVVPNFKAIGAKYRALVPGIKDALSKIADPAAARKQILATGALAMTIGGDTVSLSPEEVEIRLEAKPGWSAAQGRAGVLVLSTEVSAELRDEGLIRELIHHIQAARKERNLAYQARIGLHFAAISEDLKAIVSRFAALIREECLVTEIAFAARGGLELTHAEVENENVQFAIEPV